MDGRPGLVLGWVSHPELTSWDFHGTSKAFTAEDAGARRARVSERVLRETAATPAVILLELADYPESAIRLGAVWC